MKAELEDIPGMRRMSFFQPIEMRVNEMIAAVRSDLGIKIFGDWVGEFVSLRLCETETRGG